MFRPVYRNRTTAWMQELEQRRSSCRVGQSILGQPPGEGVTKQEGSESDLRTLARQGGECRCLYQMKSKEREILAWVLHQAGQ